MEFDTGEPRKLSSPAIAGDLAAMWDPLLRPRLVAGPRLASVDPGSAPQDLLLPVNHKLPKSGWKPMIMILNVSHTPRAVHTPLADD